MENWKVIKGATWFSEKDLILIRSNERRDQGKSRNNLIGVRCVLLPSKKRSTALHS